MSFTILVVEKTGSIKELTLKSFDESELYKKAGFKSADDFKCHVQWNIENINNKSYSICVYGKTSGRANQENKFEFPPPIDNTLFFGNCLIVNKNTNQIASLSSREWNSIYEHLYGGFEELGTEDSEEDESEDDDLPRTKSGYVKDDFIVDDDEIDEEEDEEEETECEEEDEIEFKPKKKSSTVKKPRKPKTSKQNLTVFNNLTETSENYLECTNELSEEEYI